MFVRRYDSADRDAARRIHAAAFGQAKGTDLPPPEVRLFDALIDTREVIDALCFVAVCGEQPVGHVMCSRATIAAHAVAALGPIGVLPAHQRQGVGLAMVHTALGAADALDFPLVVLLGSTSYYSRFAFRPALGLGITPPEPRWGDHFQARTLAAYEPSITGAFRYAPPFDDL